MPSVNIQAIVHELRRVLKPAAFQDLTLDDFTEATTPTGKPKINLSESGHVGIFGFAGASGSGGVVPIETGAAASAGPSSAFLNSFAQLGTLGVGVDGSFAGAALWTTIDGYDWNGFILPITPSSSPRAIIWAQEFGQIIIIGGTSAARSPDGAIWSSAVINAGLTAQAIGSNGNLLVVVGNAGAIFTSPDGVTWTSQVSGTANNLLSIAWSPTLNLWCAVGAGGTIITSPDGVTWTVQASGVATDLLDVVFAQISAIPVFVAVGRAGVLLTSQDGINWVSQVSGSINDIVSVTASGTLIAAVDRPAVGNATIITSPDGINFSQQTITGFSQANVILWTGTIFISVGNTEYASSLTGSGSWSVTANTPQALLTGLAVGPVVGGPAITGFQKNVLGGNVAVPANTLTGVISLGSVFIPSGLPQRIRVDWLINVLMGAATGVVNAWVQDGGGNVWGGSATNIAAGLNSGLSGSGLSPVRYKPGTVVSLVLNIQSNQACTAQAAAQAGGQSTHLDIATETAN